jgi:predicted nucleic acid-binding protein
VRRVIVDTGPIVAFLNRRDQYHEWAVSTFAGLQPPLFTCEPVLTEAAHLVRGMAGGREAILDLVTRNAARVDFHMDGELFALRSLLAKYASVPMSLADACLVRMSELTPKAEIVTLDRDFSIYRRSGRMMIRLITPYS